ncbi:hypothetical protein [Streptomyces sp. NPDC090021]|uniref:hypothetical protein n=1 Tax=Streptomyces sp. NPDC090021 TaxID=3365919 RepID=UPI0038221D7B
MHTGRGPSPRAGLPELLAGAGSGPVLVTCSTLGATSEALAPALGAPVLRVDRPTAAAAVRTGPRIAVLAALRSTLAPTVEADGRGHPVSVTTHLVAGARESFEAGDTARHLSRIAAADADAVTGADVIVLAQASMAGAAGPTTTRIPGPASPAKGLAAALALTAAPWGRTCRDRGKVPYMVRKLMVRKPEDTQPPVPEPDPTPAPNPFPDPEPIPRPVPPVPGPVPEPDPVPPPPGPAPVPQPGPWSRV